MRSGFIFTVTALILAGCATARPERPSAPAFAADAGRPNIVVILADDLAYSDIAPFGSEIDTPNLTRLAKSGTTFTYFHSSPMCSPSRAMLLTGVDQHRSGFGTMVEFLSDEQRGRPGYEGYLNDRVATIAERLGAHGYATYMTGKWHLGVESEPSTRGFERSFTLLQGAGSHFDDRGYGEMMPTVTYLRDGEPATLPKDFYSSDFYTSELIRHIDEGRADGRPFFAYLSFTAPHWPLHAPAETIAKYEGRYTEGYEVLRASRFAALKKAGIIAGDARLPPRGPRVVPWESLTPERRAYEAKLMAVYAAMVDRLDWERGEAARLSRCQRDERRHDDYLRFG